ncbi:contactin-like [Pomacea canaliculata]|uniref:contactin-like n=1 Tax=Pomacea canaliculata TaxID=400727 RepID=UPI000D725C6C|nr:contactin-like [Pomacea canaliculata]
MSVFWQRVPTTSTTFTTSTWTKAESDVRCEREASRPTYTWFKDGESLQHVSGDVEILSNTLTVVSPDALVINGMYQCRASKHPWPSYSTGQMRVLAQTTISTYPGTLQCRSTTTAFLSCVVSHDPELDLQTDWLFQGKPLYWKDAHYRKGSEGGLSGLYIQGCQRRHAGQYTCLAVTTFDTVTANATLTVVGPPSEPAGLTVETSLDYTSRSITLRWTPGDAGGSAVTSWTIQAATDFNPAWTFIMQNVPDSSTIVQGRERREITITELRPWTAYKFRVSARNAHGLGPYSVPSAYHQTSEGPPTLAPGNITAGEGSKLGDLSITWTPLREEDHGGAEFGYNVYYRLHDRPGNWQKGTVGDVGSFVVLVGKENFYSLYEVMVQPFNRAGAGPNSSVATIYSAEDLPIGTPGNILIFPHNSTALDITWIPVPDTKEAVRGKILGYQVNYWEDVTNPLIMSHYTGEASSGATVIGLLPNTMYVMDVQVYNSAGLGPVSEKNKQRTYNSGMTSQPTEVMVSSHGTDSVYVTWRGISRKQNEETLVSYTIATWPYTDNIRTAEIVFTGRNTYGVVRGLKKDVLYKLRVCPINLGGDGASSVELLITLGGLIRYDTTKTDILAGVGRQGGSLCTVILLLASYLLL